MQSSEKRHADAGGLAVASSPARGQTGASARSFRTLLNGLSAIVWTADPGSFRYTFVSQQAELLLGYPLERWLSEPGFWESIVHPEDRDRVASQRSQLSQKPGHIELEYRLLAADGRVLWVQDLIDFGQERGSRGPSLRGVMLEITRRREAELAAELERKRVQAAILERSRLATLSGEVGMALTQDNTLQEMLRKCAQSMVDHLDAAFARIWTLNEAEQVLELQASAGMYSHIDGPHGRVPLGMYKIGMIAQERRPHLTNHVLGDPRVGDQEWARREGMVAFAGYPLIVEDELVGVMAMFARRPLTEIALQGMGAVSREIALGIERKRNEDERDQLLELERHARSRAEQTQQQLAFLAEASTVLGSSLDYAQTLASVARLAVPTLADWCAVDVLEPDASLSRLAVIHADPAKIELAHELQRRYPADPSAPQGMHHVLRTGLPELVQEIPDEALSAAAQDQQHLRILQELGLRSYILMPLVARGQVMGVISLVMAESGRRYGPADLSLVSDLAGRAATAVDNARLYRDAQELNSQLEQRVSLRTAELETALKELETFSYSVSHDLRAPLRTIDGFSHALLEDYGPQLDSEGQDYLRRVRNASQRMALLIDDLLQLSRVTRAEMTRESVNLSALARAIRNDLQQEDPVRQVQWQIEDGLVVQGDPRLLQIALRNLLQNAWKFTARQEEPLIEFRCEQQDGRPVYMVRDNGAGFDMAYANKLFGAFQRLHADREFQGSGIGLATVQRIVRRHGGQIWAEGAVGRGATFSFILG